MVKIRIENPRFPVDINTSAGPAAMEAALRFAAPAMAGWGYRHATNTIVLECQFLSDSEKAKLGVIGTVVIESGA